MIAEFDRSVTKDQSGTQHGRDKDTVSDLAGDARRRTQCRSDDVLASEAVDDAADDHIQGDGDNVEPKDRGCKIFTRVAHFAHHGHEGLVSSISEGHVQH